MTDTTFKSGFITIIGRPNVGKSTLANAIAGQKIAIVSDKPQTTRHKIMAVINRPGIQLIFIDTPGLHRPKDPLGNRLNAIVRSTLKEADHILFMLDAASGIGRGDEFIARELSNAKTKVTIALNKVDLIDKKVLADEEGKLSKLGDFKSVHRISALKGDGLDELMAELEKHVSVGPKYFPDNMVSDQPEKILISELIREKVLNLTEEEIPYSVAVDIEEIKKRKNKELIDVRAMIYVERDSQKGILIGSSGEMIKEIGKRARVDVQKLLGSQIYLDLRVKVKKRWRRDERLMDELGY